MGSLQTVNHTALAHIWQADYAHGDHLLHLVDSGVVVQQFDENVSAQADRRGEQVLVSNIYWNF
jgi:hypothetical protein